MAIVLDTLVGLRGRWLTCSLPLPLAVTIPTNPALLEPSPTEAKGHHLRHHSSRALLFWRSGEQQALRRFPGGSY